MKLNCSLRVGPILSQLKFACCKEGWELRPKSWCGRRRHWNQTYPAAESGHPNFKGGKDLRVLWSEGNDEPDSKSQRSPAQLGWGYSER